MAEMSSSVLLLLLTCLLVLEPWFVLPAASLRPAATALLTVQRACGQASAVVQADLAIGPNLGWLEVRGDGCVHDGTVLPLPARLPAAPPGVPRRGRRCGAAPIAVTQSSASNAHA